MDDSDRDRWVARVASARELLGVNERRGRIRPGPHSRHDPEKWHQPAISSARIGRYAAARRRGDRRAGRARAGSVGVSCCAASCERFFHGNVSLHPKLDAVLRTTLDTPDFHGLRHAASAPEQARNLSGGLIWWDRLLGAYLPHPIDDPRRMLLGSRGGPGLRINLIRRRRQ